jgi:acyl carrier protein
MFKVDDKLEISITQLIRNFICENSFVNMIEYDNSSLIFKEGILDSMGFLKLITFLENEFNIQILDDDMKEENFESIDAIRKYITWMLSKKGGRAV